MKEFDENLHEIFGARSAELSNDLRGMLRQLWKEGVKLGLYMEREQKNVPPDIFAQWKPRTKEETQAIVEKDPRVAPGKTAEFEKSIEKLVEKTETLAAKIESNVDPSPTLGLHGDELLKARHKLWAQIKKLDREITKLTEFVDSFGVWAY